MKLSEVDSEQKPRGKKLSELPDVETPVVSTKPETSTDVMGTLFPGYGVAKKAVSGELKPSVVGTRALDVAKDIPSGLLGVPSDIYNLFLAGGEARSRKGLRDILSVYGKEGAVSPESILKPLPYTSEYFSEKFYGKPKDKGEEERRKLGQAIGSIISPTALAKSLKTAEVPFTVGGGPMTGVRAKAGEIAAAGEEAATARAISEVDRRLDQVPELRRHIETVTPQVEARFKDSRKEAGLPDPDARASFEAGKDINSDATKIITSKFKSAEDLKKSVGGQAFEDYKIAANVKQEAQPFGASVQGKELKDSLDEIIKGGEGSLRKYGQAAIDIARDVRNELFGRRAEDITFKEIQELADTLPKSMSPAARQIQAKQILIEKGVSQRRPVDWNLVDDKLRELRDKASKKGIESFDVVQRERVVNIADKIENSLKTWVGPENYPREVYAKSAEELNALQDKINLVARQRGEYEKGVGDIVVERNPTDIMFKDRRSTQLSKDLYGADDVNALAERYAVNKITSLGDPEKITKWLNSKESTFIDEVPGLSQKLTKYAEGLARREGDVKALEALQKRLAGIPEEVKGFSEQAQKATDAIKEGLRRIELVEPTKIYDVFVSEIRPKLEKTGAITASELDSLEKDLAAASKIANRQEAINTAKSIFMKGGLKLIGYGGPAVGALYGIFGGRE